MKEEEMKQDIEELVNNGGFNSESWDVDQLKSIKICTILKSDCCISNGMRYVCTWCCGCFQCPVDNEGFCECCNLLTLNSDQVTRTIIKIPTICLYKIPVYEEIYNRCDPPTRPNASNSSETIGQNSNDSHNLNSDSDSSIQTITESVSKRSKETNLVAPTSQNTNGSTITKPSDSEASPAGLEGFICIGTESDSGNGMHNNAEAYNMKDFDPSNKGVDKVGKKILDTRLWTVQEVHELSEIDSKIHIS